MINVLAYADDIVLCAPSWRGLQQLIDLLAIEIGNIDMLVILRKRVYGIRAKERSKLISHTFPSFQYNGVVLSFVSEFKYLDIRLHVIFQMIMTYVEKLEICLYELTFSFGNLQSVQKM